MLISDFRRMWAAAVAAAVVAVACPDAVDAALNLPQPDERLNVKVSLEVDYAKLGDALADLSRQTGVSLAAGTSDRDWMSVPGT